LPTATKSRQAHHVGCAIAVGQPPIPLRDDGQRRGQGHDLSRWPFRYRDAEGDKKLPDLPMTARCASATNPVEPGTASVIPPSKTQAAVPDETLSYAR